MLTIEDKIKMEEEAREAEYAGRPRKEPTSVPAGGGYQG